MTGDPINPDHYKSSESGVECIQITRWLSFNVGNAVKYLWRCGLKDDPRQEVAKAIWYLTDEIQRLTSPVAKWATPVQKQKWVQLFGKHLDTLPEDNIGEALWDIREAVAENNPGMLMSARHRLRTWEYKVTEAS